MSRRRIAELPDDGEDGADIDEDGRPGADRILPEARGGKARRHDEDAAAMQHAAEAEHAVDVEEGRHKEPAVIRPKFDARGIGEAGDDLVGV
jgi:hypothetical protein